MKTLKLLGKTPFMYPKFLNEKFTANYNPNNAYFFQQKTEECGLKAPKTLNELSLHKINLSLPTLLHCEDRNSMMHGIESRVPFLDYRLVELGLSLPSYLKISNGTTKHVIRQSMRNIIPNQIAKRQDKSGFAVPESSWFKNDEIKRKIKDVFEDTIYSYPEIFKQTFVESNDYKNLNSQFFEEFSIIDFGLFMRAFNVKI